MLHLIMFVGFLFQFMLFYQQFIPHRILPNIRKASSCFGLGSMGRTVQVTLQCNLLCSR